MYDRSRGDLLAAAPIATAPRDGTWFRALGSGGLDCRAHFLKLEGPSAIATLYLVSEFGAAIEATHWLAIV